MILVDVYIPSLDRVCDFQLEETATVESLILEMVEMIGSQVETGEKLNENQFFLCQCETRKILNKKAPLNSYDIKNGTRLMLV